MSWSKLVPIVLSSAGGMGWERLSVLLWKHQNPARVTLISKLLWAKWARQTYLFFQLFHFIWLHPALGTEWMLTQGGEGSSNSERISQNHLAEEWGLLPRWKLLIEHLTKLGSLVIGNFFQVCFFIPLPALHAFGFRKEIYARWLLLVLVGGWGGTFLHDLVKSWMYLSWKMPPC